MKKVISIGLFALLLYHTLAYMLVCVVMWWQAEHDLSERLMVYRSVDSLVEFQLPLINKTDGSAIARTTSDGFRYRGHDFSVVSLEVRNDTLHLTGLEVKGHAFWPDDLLSFLNSHSTGATESPQKANQYLKFLLKEYSPSPRAVFCFSHPIWRPAVCLPELRCPIVSRALAVQSPPPEA